MSFQIILGPKKPQAGQIAVQIFHPFLSHQEQKITKISKSITTLNSPQQLVQIQDFKPKRRRHRRSDRHQVLKGQALNEDKEPQQEGPDFTKTIRHILKSNYQTLLEAYEGTDKLYSDPDFPPVGQSIGGRWINHNNWKRISQVIPDAVFVNQKIQPSDILQGQIGDCYFLSALAALAEKDYRIKNIFPSLQIQKNGIYMAKILHRGILQEVVVDDFIPVNAKNQPLFAKPSGGKQIWVIILEKCWAKLHKSYAAISGGLPHEVLHAFSGAPTFYNSMPVKREQQDQLFKVIYEADKNEALLCCGTKSDLSIQKKGLVIGHAYTLLEVYDKPFKMVKVRNPWGQKQWNGRASQYDKEFWSKFTQEEKQRLKMNEKNDGIFFMLWEDFVEVFNMVDVCLIQDDASYLCVSRHFRYGRGKIFQLKVQTQGSLVIAVTQDNIRCFASDQQKRRGYAKTTIILSKFNQKKKGYTYSFLKASQFQILPDHYLSLENVEPGKYMVFVECSWFQRDEKQATVSVYTSQKVQLERKSNIDPDEFLYEVFMDHARRNSKKRQSLSQEYEEWKCEQFLLGRCDYGYAAYHLDQKSPASLGIQLNQQDYESKNMYLMKPYAGYGKVKTAVNPGQQLIIVFKIDPYKTIPSFTVPLPRVYKLVK